jgi:hypothetical protein
MTSWTAAMVTTVCSAAADVTVRPVGSGTSDKANTVVPEARRSVFLG